MKIAAFVIGGLLVAVGIADLTLGNTNSPILPSALTNNLTQQTDVAALVIGGGVLWLAATQL